MTNVKTDYRDLLPGSEGSKRDTEPNDEKKSKGVLTFRDEKHIGTFESFDAPVIVRPIPMVADEKK